MVYVLADLPQGIEDLSNEKDVQQGQKEDVEADQNQDKPVYRQYAGASLRTPKEIGKNTPKQDNTKSNKKNQASA
jgi:hypothetical protein